MKSTLTVFAFLVSPLASSAWPLFSAQNPKRNLHPRSPATYSVVPVDGGSSTEASTPTQTQTQTITMAVTQTLLSTSVSTSVVTENEIPATIYNTVVVTLTSVVPTTIYNTVSMPGTTEVSTEITTSTDLPTTSTDMPSATTDTSPYTVTVDAPAATVTVEPSTVTEIEAPSSTPYDNGMWHTTYYQYWTPSPSSEAAPEATISTAAWVPPVDWSTDPMDVPFPGFPSS